MTRMQALQDKMNEAHVVLSEAAAMAISLRVDITKRLQGDTSDESLAGYGPSDADFYLTRFVAAASELSGPRR